MGCLWRRVHATQCSEKVNAPSTFVSVFAPASIALLLLLPCQRKPCLFLRSSFFRLSCSLTCADSLTLTSSSIISPQQQLTLAFTLIQAATLLLLRPLLSVTPFLPLGFSPLAPTIISTLPTSSVSRPNSILSTNHRYHHSHFYSSQPFDNVCQAQRRLWHARYVLYTLDMLFRVLLTFGFLLQVEKSRDVVLRHPNFQETQLGQSPKPTFLQQISSQWLVKCIRSAA